MAVDAVVDVGEVLDELQAAASIETTATEMAAHRTPFGEGGRVGGFLSMPRGYWHKIRIYGTSSYEDALRASIPGCGWPDRRGDRSGRLKSSRR